MKKLSMKTLITFSIAMLGLIGIVRAEEAVTETANAVKASGADIVTVAVRRVNILDKKQPSLMDYLDPKSITYLPNTAGCYSSSEALRTLRLAREMGGWR